MMRRIRTVLIMAMGFGALQLAPGPERTNPPVQAHRTIAATTQVTPQVGTLLRRACGNCHTNETRWPWYSRVAPLSWMLARDVAQGRNAMNFSEWEPERASGVLGAACNAVESGLMPPKSYLLLHPEARWSRQETQTFCDWTRDEIMRAALTRSAQNSN